MFVSAAVVAYVYVRKRKHDIRSYMRLRVSVYESMVWGCGWFRSEYFVFVSAPVAAYVHVRKRKHDIRSYVNVYAKGCGLRRRKET